MVFDRVVLEEMAAGWSAGFVAFVGRFAGLFPRVESRRQMRVYVRGLLSEVERKNGWTLAEAAGDVGPQRMQRLLNFYVWDTVRYADGVDPLVPVPRLPAPPPESDPEQLRPFLGGWSPYGPDSTR